MVENVNYSFRDRDKKYIHIYTENLVCNLNLHLYANTIFYKQRILIKFRLITVYKGFLKIDMEFLTDIIMRFEVQ